MSVDPNTVVTLIGLAIAAVGLWFSQKADRRASQEEMRKYIDGVVQTTKENIQAEMKAGVMLFDQWRQQHEAHEREVFAKVSDTTRIEAKIDYVMTGIDDMKGRLERDLGGIDRRVNRMEDRRDGVQASDS